MSSAPRSCCATPRVRPSLRIAANSTARRTYQKEDPMDRIRKADYFSMQVSNKAGEAARFLGALRDAGVNLLAFTGFPSGKRAQVDFVPENAAKFRTAARKIGMKVGTPKTVFIAQGDDRVGAIAEICERIAATGVNMTAMDAIASGDGRYAAIFWVEARAVNKV